MRASIIHVPPALEETLEQRSDVARLFLAKFNCFEEENMEAKHMLSAEVAKGEVSPWLEMTRWPKHLVGHDLRIVFGLADLQ